MEIEDDQTMRLADESIEMWTRATIESADHDRAVLHNFNEMQVRCERWLLDMQEDLDELLDDFRRNEDESLKEKLVRIEFALFVMCVCMYVCM